MDLVSQSLPRRLALVLALLLGIAVVPAAALPSDELSVEDEAVVGCYHKDVDEAGEPVGPAFCTEDVWFHRAETLAGNIAAAGAGSFPSWSTEAPTQSVQDGAGAGFLTVGPPRQLASDPESDPYTGATFEGTYTGNLDNLVVELFMFAPATAASDTGNFVGSIELEIDDTLVLWPTQVDVPLESGGDAVMKTKFAITDLHEAMGIEGLETGDDVEHTIRFFFSGFGLASGTAVVVFDTTEVPSGMTFNAPDVEGLPRFSA
jgi:hypothetical protein